MNYYSSRSIYALVMGLALLTQPVTSQLRAQAAPKVDTHELRATAFVNALNQDDPMQYEAFMQEHRATSVLNSSTTNERADSFVSLKNDLGSLGVMGVMRVSDTETRVLVESKNMGGELEIIFGHEPDTEAKLTTIQFAPSTPDLVVPDDWQSLQELLDGYVGVTQIPAWAVAVVSNGVIVDVAAAGVKQVGKDEPITIEDRFHWGSVTKSLTATVAASLVEKGKITWDTKITDLFEAKRVKQEYHNVTLSDMLNHRSGLPGYDDFEEEFMLQMQQGHPTDPVAQRAYWVEQMLAQDAPIYTPGQGHRYSNGGYVVAGRMLELASGKPWEQLVSEHIFIPLKMQSAGTGWPQSVGKMQPAGHFGMDTQELEVAPVSVMTDLVRVLAPAGNVHSSITDFAQYSLLHLNGLKGDGTILKPATIKHLHQPPAGELNRPEPYSFGWGHTPLPNGQTMQWHNGGAGSFYAEARLVPEQDIGFVIMANAGVAERFIGPLWQALYKRYVQD